MSVLNKIDKYLNEKTDKLISVDLNYKRGAGLKTIFDFPAYRVSNQSIKISKYDLRKTRNPNIGIKDIAFLTDEYGHRYGYIEQPPELENIYYLFQSY